MRKRFPAAERHAELIRIALMEAAPSGLPLRRLMAACELSEYQTRSGLTAMRDLCGERGWPPLIWTRADGYHFCASVLEEWERVWISEKLTAFRRMITGTLAPHLALFPRSRWANYLDFGGDALRCLWSKHQTNYPMFAEAVWLLHREFSEGAGAEHHPLFADLPPIPAEVLFRKIANSSAVAFRKLTADQMVEILRKAPQDYAVMR
ncbi:hypothetical protein [Streptomyces afghaniensis]|uniref:hypothetical protein n=1 Tax=Streptomyces afghaniensis TaxID=66865 RepID=UPI0037B19B3D